MIHFSKYHGCGNDFIIVDEAELIRVGIEPSAIPALAKRICHRRLGIGADGLIIVRRDPLTMDIINSDGSVAPMCGNGIRCFARHCLASGIVPAGTEKFDVNTLAGVMPVRVSFAGGFTAEIDMGHPDWSARAAGIDEDGEFIGRTVSVGSSWDTQDVMDASGATEMGDDIVKGGAGDTRDVMGIGDATGVDNAVCTNGATEMSGDIVTSSVGDTRGESVRLSSMFLGTYHTVVWLDENEWLLDGQPRTDGLHGNPQIDRVGKILESHPTFTKRTNVNFVRVIDRHTVEMITWERGVGLTAACGTGASSVVALGIREGRLGQSASAELESGTQGADGTGGTEVKVILSYGELFIRQDRSGEIYMRGPAEHVFDGEFYE